MTPEDSGVLLSFVIGARNDNYMGDFKWRLSTTLNCIAANLELLGRLPEVEVMVCDWGSEVPICEILNLNPAARTVTRFVQVSPAVAAVAQKDSAFPIPLAQNTAIRRCRGKFIAQTDSDVLFPRHSLVNLLSILDGGRCLDVSAERFLFVAGRRHIPYSVVSEKQTLQELERYVALNGTMLKPDRLLPGFATPSALALMHRSLWETCGGYDERLIYWGWMEIDLYLRITQGYPWLDLTNFGVALYHLEHYPNNDRSKQARPMNPTRAPLAFRANDAGWGLAYEALTIRVAERAGEPIPTSAADAAVSLRNQTPQMVLSALKDDEVRAHLQQVAETTPTDLRESAALCALSWYALRCRPQAYLEFGVRFAYAAVAVALACADVEIYGVDSWRPVEGQPDLSPNYFAETLARLGYLGHARLITGDPQTAFRRLESSFVGKPEFDLVMFRGDFFGGQALQRASEIVPHVASGGVLVVSWDVPAAFVDFWSQFQTAFTHQRLMQIDQKTGLFIA